MKYISYIILDKLNFIFYNYSFLVNHFQSSIFFLCESSYNLLKSNPLFHTARGLYAYISINNIITRVATTITLKYKNYNKLKMKNSLIQENDTSEIIEGSLKGEISQEMKDNQEK